MLPGLLELTNAVPMTWRSISLSTAWCVIHFFFKMKPKRGSPYKAASDLSPMVGDMPCAWALMALCL